MDKTVEALAKESEFRALREINKNAMSKVWGCWNEALKSNVEQNSKNFMAFLYSKKLLFKHFDDSLDFAESCFENWKNNHKSTEWAVEMNKKRWNKNPRLDKNPPRPPTGQDGTDTTGQEITKQERTEQEMTGKEITEDNRTEENITEVEQNITKEEQDMKKQEFEERMKVLSTLKGADRVNACRAIIEEDFEWLDDESIAKMFPNSKMPVEQEPVETKAEVSVDPEVYEFIKSKCDERHDNLIEACNQGMQDKVKNAMLKQVKKKFNVDLNNEQLCSALNEALK